MLNMNLKELQYVINNIIIASLFFKENMTKAELNTMMTSAAIRLELQELDAQMIELHSNVKGFAKIFNKSIKKLKVRSRTTNEEDLALNLMKAMNVV